MLQFKSGNYNNIVIYSELKESKYNKEFTDIYKLIKNNKAHKILEETTNIVDKYDDDISGDNIYNDFGKKKNQVVYLIDKKGTNMSFKKDIFTVCPE